MPLNELPEGCIANALSFTTPQDVGRLSAVSPMFMSAAVSDVVWERFLPRDLESILSTSPDGSRLLASAASKKELYFSLCENPVLSFSLEKKSGKKCCRLSARDLLITWGDAPEYWTWNSDPASRFPEVAELISVCWLEICAKINTSMLSPTTLHTAYLVLKFSIDTNIGLDGQPVEVTMKLDGEESCKRTVSWNAERRWGQVSRNARESDGHYPQERGDGWLEIELGEFLTKEGKDEELEMRVFDGSSHWKRGLIVEGIEIRPKQGNQMSNSSYTSNSVYLICKFLVQEELVRAVKDAQDGLLPRKWHVEADKFPTILLNPKGTKSNGALLCWDLCSLAEVLTNFVASVPATFSNAHDTFDA
ncbi:hypothetical protein DKX38_010752 [Salix brachista]|uniref:F-box domain-containing protein n=1 Tax=Salix brachista TaxID=2182728 RepID=A0A5N5MGV9_9ROSI|nr:hypothetical protein DKX38_010752 [Salix brachista]